MDVIRETRIRRRRGTCSRGSLSLHTRHRIHTHIAIVVLSFRGAWVTTIGRAGCTSSHDGQSERALGCVGSENHAVLTRRVVCCMSDGSGRLVSSRTQFQTRRFRPAPVVAGALSWRCPAIHRHKPTSIADGPQVEHVCGVVGRGGGSVWRRDEERQTHSMSNLRYAIHHSDPLPLWKKKKIKWNEGMTPFPARARDIRGRPPLCLLVNLRRTCVEAAHDAGEGEHLHTSGGLAMYVSHREDARNGFLEARRKLHQ